MRSLKELKKFIDENDSLGMTFSDYIDFLPFEEAKKYFTDKYIKDVKSGKEVYTQKEYSEEAIIEEMRDYLEFAWDKANACRGLSAGRSLQHYRNWFYALGSEFDDFATAIAKYEYYGKPWLWLITELFNLDPKKFDEDGWTSGDYDPGTYEYYYISQDKIDDTIKKAKLEVNFDKLKSIFNSRFSKYKAVK